MAGIPIKLAISPDGYVIHKSGTVTSNLVNEGHGAVTVVPRTVTLKLIRGQCRPVMGAQGVHLSLRQFTMAPGAVHPYPVRVRVPSSAHGSHNILVTFEVQAVHSAHHAAGAVTYIAGKNNFLLTMPTVGAQHPCVALGAPVDHHSGFGGVIALAVLVALIAAILVYMRRRHNRKRSAA